VPKKDRKTVIDLLSETMGPSELRKQKNIWKIFGHNDYYEAEKEEQEAIYEELQWKKKLSPSPPSPLGGVGMRRLRARHWRSRFSFVIW
jgi:hypothetical protein